jgi:hypothetical protein
MRWAFFACHTLEATLSGRAAFQSSLRHLYGRYRPGREEFFVRVNSELNASDTVKITLGLISSSWIQWWHCRRCSAPVEVNGKELRTSYPSNK